MHKLKAFIDFFHECHVDYYDDEIEVVEEKKRIEYGIFRDTVYIDQTIKGKCSCGKVCYGHKSIDERLIM